MGGRRRVLVIAYYFPPMGTSGVLRVTKFVKYLPEYGWEPIVLTATPSAFFAYDPTLLEELELRRVLIERTPDDGNPWWIKRRAAPDGTVELPSQWMHTLWLRWSQFWWTPDRVIRWKRSALELGWRLLRRYEPAILFATAPPFTDLLIAAELARRSGLPYIVDYQDPWVGDPERWYPTPWHRRRHQRLERAVLARMAVATVVIRALKENLLRCYPELLTHEDVAIVWHGYDSEDFAAVGAVQQPEDRLLISFIGVFKHGNPQTVLQAVARFLQRHPPARQRLELRWVGIVRPEHRRMVEELGLGSVVRTLGYVPHREAIRQMLQAHVLWVDNRPMGSPLKVFEYFGARRPLLACVPAQSPIQSLLQACGAAYWAEHGDVETMTQHVAELYQRWEERSLPTPSEEFVHTFDMRALTGELARLLSLHAAL